MSQSDESSPPENSPSLGSRFDMLVKDPDAYFEQAWQEATAFVERARRREQRQK